MKVKQNNQVILVIIDGLAYDTATDCMGYLQSLVEQRQATLYQLQSELPSLSRPLYETILTGTSPLEHGVLHNQIVRRSTEESVFSLARQAGLTTAAAAYHWFSELYNTAPFIPERDRLTNNPSLLIQHGLFYHEDHYPDSHLFCDAEILRQTYQPDFLLVHPMNTDDAGHKAGYDSGLYRNTVRRADVGLSGYLHRWRAEGYQILVTSDHGMNNDHSHGGTLAMERLVPLYVIGDGWSHNDDCR
ncbi:alkaline phosphatase family protein [Vibrio quintilis]|uniref:Type I phosphodiesterase / nucleotide pyrophosphatase n=1 Tax=Vibrio quintilis TaxID=1117707 RepID=A0A1M7Z1Y9_9VIBR|nr:alkaline phosphatase family protein [Vibrio quintilis]SHO58686.1 Type I phosphodiesterase / nucleotide pyrophosphatase [Vibrio quintilis]